MTLSAKFEPWREKPALITAGTGEVFEFADLDHQSLMLARFLRAKGMNIGDRFALLMENRFEFFVGMWAARRAGLYFVPINWHLKEVEAQYVVANSNAKGIFTSSRLIDVAERIADRCGEIRLRISADHAKRGFESLQGILESSPEQFEERIQGGVMPYSSGTTGLPKGIVRPLGDVRVGMPTNLEQLYKKLYGIDEGTIYLCPAPMYHSAPISLSQAVQFYGGTVVLLESFDAEETLRAIEQYGITVAQFVPTHFVRMLKLPKHVRAQYDVSSLKTVLHAAASCPIVHEFYGGSERCGLTSVTPSEWLARPGTVGKSKTGAIHILDPETGETLAAGEVGLIYFENPDQFAYHNVSETTASCFNSRGWGTFGDLGRLDDDGYLYLADRRTDVIISGGVNIYPQEVENLLSSHPAVADVAVIGVPNSEFGAEVKAVVQLADQASDPAATEAELIEYCRARLSHFKCPRSIDFVDSLPRQPNGKLLKRELRALYLAAG
jgi:acyl-CoA synthetase (AMP-forming)/AMP-acid ligase II